VISFIIETLALSVLLLIDVVAFVISVDIVDFADDTSDLIEVTAAEISVYRFGCNTLNNSS